MHKTAPLCNLFFEGPLSFSSPRLVVSKRAEDNRLRSFMVSTEPRTAAIHITFAFTHLFVPLWRRRDREKMASLIRAPRQKARAHSEKKAPGADCLCAGDGQVFPTGARDCIGGAYAVGGGIFAL
uniref:Uncharacterized protein n=1 Tax=Candidatus Kentrum sp. FW TaxID=2126338 RepID=A0A450TM06_9GAMM|nr:MAG: hypothetical protein BECKFW1821C_GA0114237_10162 [Candidatus Kentron sp. FW]